MKFYVMLPDEKNNYKMVTCNTEQDAIEFLAKRPEITNINTVIIKGELLRPHLVLK